MTMNDESSNERRTLTDGEMEQLLSSFYQMEIPEALEHLPSSWPELRHRAMEQRQTSAVSLAPAVSTPDVKPSSTVSRGIAVAVTTLAASLMVMAFNSVDTETQPDDATFQVHGGEQDGALDENSTSLKEIDQIDLSPNKKELASPKTPQSDR